MTVDEIRAALTDEQALALTLHGEAASEPIEGRIAVACVIRNRMAQQDETVKEVCFAPAQFSCWAPVNGQANHERLMRLAEGLVTGVVVQAGSILDESLWVAHGVLSKSVRDRVSGATHYYAPAAMVPPGREPKWTLGHSPVAVIGAHRFYRL